MIRPILEVCISSPETGALAVELGADRLELCAALQLGGITPHLSLLKYLRQTGVPLGVLIRCRPGHFVYSNLEKELMLDQASGFFDAGADFLVMGALTESNHLDCEFLDQIDNQFDTQKVVFHRAFDRVTNPFEAIDELAARGFQRILTSGENAFKVNPIAQLKALVIHAAQRIGILPGGGIRAQNGALILNETGATELHASCLIKNDLTQKGFGSLERLDKDALLALRKGMDSAYICAEKGTCTK